MVGRVVVGGERFHDGPGVLGAGGRLASGVGGLVSSGGRHSGLRDRCDADLSRLVVAPCGRVGIRGHGGGLRVPYGGGRAKPGDTHPSLGFGRLETRGHPLAAIAPGNSRHHGVSVLPLGRAVETSSGTVGQNPEQKAPFSVYGPSSTRSVSIACGGSTIGPVTGCKGASARLLSHTRPVLPAANSTAASPGPVPGWNRRTIQPPP